MVIQYAIKVLVISFLITSCGEKVTKVKSDSPQKPENTVYDSLKERALQNVDSSKWDMELYQQDIETYGKLSGIFDGFPLTKSPFPVAFYDYAVSSDPLNIEIGEHVFKGVRIGEFEDPDSDKVIDKVTLLILTKNKDVDDNVLVESRNYPYLTAQGTFYEPDTNFDWVFAASPDNFSILMINMKLFDLRFGETVIIYPQNDMSFLYDQIDDSPNNYSDFEDFKKAISSNRKVLSKLNARK